MSRVNQGGVVRDKKAPVLYAQMFLGRGGGGVERDQISDIRPPKIRKKIKYLA